MPLLLFLARAFINTFGITQPTPQNERRAAYFIGATLTLVLLVVGMVAIAFLHIRV